MDCEDLGVRLLLELELVGTLMGFGMWSMHYDGTVTSMREGETRSWVACEALHLHECKSLGATYSIIWITFGIQAGFLSQRLQLLGQMCSILSI